MSTRGRSGSPMKDADMGNGTPPPSSTVNSTSKVVIVSGLTRNVLEPHLQTIFSFYGAIRKVDLPVHAKSRQNRGKAAIEFVEAAAAAKALSHMHKGILDGVQVTLELSDLALPASPPPPRSATLRDPRANGRDRRRSLSRSRSRSRSRTPSRSRSRSPRRGASTRYPNRFPETSYRGRGGYGGGRRGPPPRDSYRRRSNSRSRSPRRGPPPARGAVRRRSPSYERGGDRGGRGRARGAWNGPAARNGNGGRRSRSRTRSRSPYSARSSRSRSRSYSRSPARSYSSYSSRSRSRTRSRSRSRGSRRSIRSSRSRDDIRDSRSRSRTPPKEKADKD